MNSQVQFANQARFDFHRFYLLECGIAGILPHNHDHIAKQPGIVVHAGDGDEIIILEGNAAMVTNAQEWQRLNNASMTKYVDPHSGARACLSKNDNLYRVDVKRVMCWEYGIELTRTDWVAE